MRKLMWLTIGFGTACGLWAYGMQNIRFLLPAAIGFILMVVVLCISRKKEGLRLGILVLAGASAGLLWSSGYDFCCLRPLAQVDGSVLTLKVSVSSYSESGEYGTSLDGVTALQGKEYRIRVYLDEKAELKPGDSLEGVFRLRQAMAGEENDSTYFQGQGIYLLGYQQEDIAITKTENIPLKYFPAVLRQRILRVLDTLFPADTAPFAKALLLGHRKDLDYKTTTALEISGIIHIVAVSGMHISILYGAVSVLTLHRRFLTAILGMPLLLLFAAVAGMTPSVQRSCLMVGLMMLARVLDREYDGPSALAFAVLVMLLINPLAVTAVSLQLSAGCVAGILMFHRRISQWMKNRVVKQGIGGKLLGLAAGNISVTLSSMILITPLSAWYFGAVSLVSPLTNLLTLWVTNGVFYGLIMICLVYLAWPGAALVLAELLSWPIRYVLGVAEALASLPVAAVYMKSIYLVLWLVFLYVLLGLYLTMKKKRPGVLLCCGSLGLCLALLASWTEPLTASTTITMLDVGQGQSILLQSEGKTFLVDCGGDDEEQTADLVAQTLLSQGIARLDGIILTHFDRDHAGAVAHLLSRVDTDALFLPDTQNEFPVPETTGQIFYVWEDLELSVGQAALRIFGPVYAGLDNENSLCVLFDTEKCDILITGDRSAFGERMLMRRRTLPHVDILVAGHHGAEDAVSDALLEQVQPELVLISAGENNIYGHPSPGLLQRLEKHGCTVFRTDINGTIQIRR